MKKIDIEFNDVTPELIAAITKAYPYGFADNDVMTFKHVDEEMEDRVKIIFNDTLFLIKKSLLDEVAVSKFDADYFKSLPRENENWDAEYCE
jgi:hypothetical protein